MTRITITLEGVYPEYSEALRRSSEDTEQLKELFAAFDFERSDLKTLDFSVDAEYESYKEKSAWKERFIGYKYQHVMKIEFESDNDRLGRILYALANCHVKPEFRLSYTVRDPEAAKNELLGKAVTDAREKAYVLTKAAGISLKEIQNIDYSWGEIDFEVKTMKEMVPPCGGTIDNDLSDESYDLNVEPDNITVSDTVTVIWEIG